MKGYGKTLVALLIASCILLLGGCGLRSRVMPEALAAAQTEQVQQPTEETASLEEVPEEPQEILEDEELPSENDPQSERKEYDSEQDGEIAPDAEQRIAAEVQTPAEAKPAAPAEAVETTGEAEKTVEVFVEADASEQKAAAEDAPAASSMLEYYQALLTSRLESQFECKKLDIYWETPAAFATVNRQSAEQAIITLAGSYNVGVKLEADALTVDGGWVSRKNPGAIVKVVPREALASGESALAEIRGREGLAETDAVRSGRVILLAEDLLNTAAGQTAAAVEIACRLYPQLMDDVDPGEALRQLMEEAGRSAAGTYWY
ncbi:MAG: hypothetical protein K5981_09780 [Clostridia bacterium]|nr:hypothetical protein [Clostridia bacterium]